MLSIELDPIEHFLEQSLKDIDAEFLKIEAEWDETQAQTADDFANLMYHPSMREEITLRAIYYELNALIERNLQEFAQEAYWKSQKYPCSIKSIWDIKEKNDIRKLKLISDLKIDEIRQLLEGYCNISLNEMNHFGIIVKIREIANSFKHRNGFKDFRRDLKAGLRVNISDKHELTREDARVAIVATRKFLLDIFHNLARTKSQQEFLEDNDNGD